MFRPVPGPSYGIAAAPVLITALVDAETTSDAASSRLSMVIAGLIALAVVIAVSTFFFWRATRPDRAGGGEIGIRWIQPDEPSTTWATSPSPAAAPTPAPSSAPAPAPGPAPASRPATAGPGPAPRPAAPRPAATRPVANPAAAPGPLPESSGPDYRALRARPADG